MNYREAIITAVEIGDKNAGDSPMLPALVESTAQRFNMKEVSGDTAYLSESNVAAIRNVGATPFIAFKSKSVSRKNHSKVWRDMYFYFMWKHEDFLKRYHKRSNVESTFSMMKRKFCDSLRSK